MQRLKTIVGVLWFCSTVARAADVVRWEVTVPAGTTGDVFVSGSPPALGNWSGAGLKLTRRADGVYVGEVAGTAGEQAEYKFTRGSWATVEKTSGGSDRANRSATFAAGVTVVKATVERWAVASDGPTTRRSTVTGHLEVHEIESKVLGNKRKVWVWLPPGYEGAVESAGSERVGGAGLPVVYPVLYMADGRNLFDEATSAFAREWGLDESATKLIEAKQIRPVIIVGIDHGDRRTEEYGGAALGFGKQYGRFVVEEVMPFVNVRYRTDSGPGKAFVGGSSMGGLVSLAMLMDYSETFSGALVASPSLWFEDGAVLKRAEAGGVSKDANVWIDIGRKEGDRHIANVRTLKAALEKEGVRVAYQEAEGAEHNEAAWAERVPAMLKFLFGK